MTGRRFSPFLNCCVGRSGDIIRLHVSTDSATPNRAAASSGDLRRGKDPDRMFSAIGVSLASYLSV